MKTDLSIYLTIAIVYAALTFIGWYGAYSVLQFDGDIIRIFVSILLFLVLFGFQLTIIYSVFKSTYEFSTIFACILILLGIVNLPFIYYQFLRCFVFTIGISCILLLAGSLKQKMLYVFKVLRFIHIVFLSAVIILFNPILPSEFSKENWIIIDVISFFVFIPFWFTNYLEHKIRK